MSNDFDPGECTESSDGTTNCETGRTVNGDNDRDGKYTVTSDVYDTKTGNYLGVKVCEWDSSGWTDGKGKGDVDLLGCTFSTSQNVNNNLNLSINSDNSRNIHSNGDVSEENRVSGHDIVKALDGINAVNAADKVKDAINVINSAAEVYDIAHKTNVAKKLKQVNWLDYHNPYDVNSPFISNRQFSLAKVTTGLGKSIGLGVAWAVAKEIDDNGVDGTRITSAATIGIIDTLLTTAVAGAAALIFAPTSAPLALAVTVSVGIVFALESITGGPYSDLKNYLTDRLDEALSSFPNNEGDALKKQILDLSETFKNGAEEVKQNSNFVDLDRCYSLNDKAKVLMMNDNDNEVIAGNRIDIISGGKGKDTISYQRSTSSVNVNLLTAETSGGYAEGDVLSSDLENIIGSSKDDRLIGTNSGNTIIGGLGNDYIETGDGDDLVVGSYKILSDFEKPDHIYLKGKCYRATDNCTNIIKTGSGDDIIIGSENDYISGGKGNDSVIFSKRIINSHEANTSKINKNGTTYTKYHFGIKSINISDDVENIYIFDDEYYEKIEGYGSRGRWTYKLNNNGKLSEKFWTQEDHNGDQSKLEVIKSNKITLGSRLVIDYDQNGFIDNFSEYNISVHEELHYKDKGSINNHEKLFDRLGYLYNGKFTSLHSLGVVSIDFSREKPKFKRPLMYMGGDRHNSSDRYFMDPFVQPVKSNYQFNIYYKDGGHDTIFDGNRYDEALQHYKNMNEYWSNPNYLNSSDFSGTTDPSIPYINPQHIPGINSPRFPVVNTPYLTNAMASFAANSEGARPTIETNYLSSNINHSRLITSNL